VPFFVTSALLLPRLTAAGGALSMRTAAAALLLLALYANPASACSCLSNGPPCQWYFQVDAVFAGAVTVISEIDGPPDLPYPLRLVRFAVERGFRGVDAATAEAVTGMGGGDCGYPFKTGERYLVYAYRNQEGRLVTGICSRTRPLAEADEDLAFIQDSGRRRRARGCRERSGTGNATSPRPSPCPMVKPAGGRWRSESRRTSRAASRSRCTKV